LGEGRLMARFGWDEDVDWLRVPGVYAELLERERQLTAAGDPRRVASGTGQSFMRRSPVLFEELSAGGPVRVPRWALGGHTVPDERVRRMKREDATITGWLVGPDDSVTPLREGG
jgi:hypothetical protein